MMQKEGCDIVKHRDGKSEDGINKSRFTKCGDGIVKSGPLTSDSGIVTSETWIVTSETGIVKSGIVTSETGIVTSDTRIVTSETGIVKSGGEDVMDPRLLLAEKESLESNRMLPVIKEELRLRIMSKRHAQGKDEIVVDFNNNKPTYELTEAEREKKKRRREQNRRAAQRCRLKKKRMQKGTTENYEMIFEKHVELKAEVKSLSSEVLKLQAILDNHVMSESCCRLNPQHQTHDAPQRCHPLSDNLVNYDTSCVTTIQRPATNASPSIGNNVPDNSSLLCNCMANCTDNDVPENYFIPMHNCTNNDVTNNSFVPCGWMPNCTDSDVQDMWFAQRARQQTESSSSAWSDDSGLSDIVSNILVMEDAGLPADGPFDGTNQSFYDSARNTPCEYQTEKPQCQIVYNQVDELQSPAHERLDISNQDEESNINQFNEQSTLYLEDNFAPGLDNLEAGLGCDQNYFDLNIAGP